jgi:hypothetical protein
MAPVEKCLPSSMRPSTAKKKKEKSNNLSVKILLQNVLKSHYKGYESLSLLAK